MDKTRQLIEELSTQATPVKAVQPHRDAVFLLAILLIYAVCAECWLEGFRPDIGLQLSRPLFLVELLFLLVMLVSAIMASMYAMLPDNGQAKPWMRLAYASSAGMFLLVAGQLPLPQDARMVMPSFDSHTHECTFYIALSSVIPSGLIFGLLRKGASVMPMQAGLLAVIAALSVGALTLRLAEANDDIWHLLYWHYLPSLIFATLGALLGRYLLRW